MFSFEKERCFINPCSKSYTFFNGEKWRWYMLLYLNRSYYMQFSFTKDLYLFTKTYLIEKKNIKMSLKKIFIFRWKCSTLNKLENVDSKEN